MSEFVSQCASQDAYLTQTDWDSRGHHFKWNVYDLLKQSFIELRQNPHIKLISKPIAEAPFMSDDMARALVQVLNASVKPVKLSPSWKRFRYHTTASAESCSAAEYYFQQLAFHLLLGTTDDCQVFTHHRKPVFVRKGDMYGYPSALTLTDITSNGIPVKEFSIVRLSAKCDTYKRNHLHISTDGLELYNIRDIIGVNPVRPTVFSFSKAIRKDYFQDEDEVPDTESSYILKAIAKTLGAKMT